MRKGRRRHQVLLTLLPGSEPWVLVEVGAKRWRMPAGVSVLELLERLEDLPAKVGVHHGELYVRARLDQVVTAPRRRTPPS